MVKEKRLTARFLARLKPGSLEPEGPVGKPAYLDRWHRLKMGRSLKFLEERSVAETMSGGNHPACPLGALSAPLH